MAKKGLEVLSILCTVSVLIVSKVVAVENSSDEPTVYPILKPKSEVDLELNGTIFGDHNDEIDLIDSNGGKEIELAKLFRNCGEPMDGCNLNNTLGGAGEGRRFDYLETPLRCRCDDKCLKYGDCCVSILKQTEKITRNPYWRCRKLLNTMRSIRMISKCPPDYANNLSKELCENYVPETYSGKGQASLDVPVLHNATGDVYRNIFCARCHSISNKDIYLSDYKLLCSNFTSREEWEVFQKNADYEPGKLLWRDRRNASLYCKLQFEELEPENITNLIPDVRFCNTDPLEDCSINDQSSEDRKLLYNLCHSYNQIVIISVPSEEEEGAFFRPLYKNPHCAKCNHPKIDIHSDAQCVRATPRGRGQMTPAFGTRQLSIDDGSVGLNILFHFSLFEDGPVGYTSKCDDNEILDFIRQKCVPMICPQGYELNDGECEEIEPNSSESSEGEGNGTSLITPRNNNNSNSTNGTLISSQPCLLIILHPDEYYQLENGSITVNKSGNSGVLMFNPGEYESYNESSMAVCAEQVDKTFSGFAPALSYISNILLAISVLCSFVHIFLYSILPKMRNLPGNNLLCLTACLLISQFLFLIFIKSSNTSVCVASSIIMHYLFIASFCWMNIMSFDIWRTFSSEFLVRRYSGDSTKTFLKYSLFAWIVPFIIVLLAVTTDFFLPEWFFSDPEFGPLMKKLRPLYGHNNLCWISQKLSLFIFFAFPVAVIILCNCILFTLTASTIWLQNREGNKLINGTVKGEKDLEVVGGKGKGKTPLRACNSGSTKRSDTVRFKLYAKLALIMGLTWILGFLSGFGWEWVWYPFVIFNGLQGTFIFVAFDFKPKVWQMVKERFGWFKWKRSTDDDASSSDMKRRGTSSQTLSTTLRSISSRTSNGSTGNANGLILSEKPIQIYDKSGL